MKYLLLIPFLLLTGCVTGALLNQYDMACYSRTATKEEYRNCIFEQQAQAEAQANNAVNKFVDGVGK